MTPEFFFVENIAVRLSKKKDIEGESSLNNVEKTVVDIWDAAGLIGNGGIQYWILSSSAQKAIILQLIDIDMKMLSSVIENVFNILNGLELCQSSTHKEAFVAKHETKLTELSREWNNNSDFLADNLAIFIKSNWNDIEEAISNYYVFWL